MPKKTGFRDERFSDIDYTPVIVPSGEYEVLLTQAVEKVSDSGNVRVQLALRITGEIPEEIDESRIGIIYYPVFIPNEDDEDWKIANSFTRLGRVLAAFGEETDLTERELAESKFKILRDLADKPEAFRKAKVQVGIESQEDRDDRNNILRFHPAA